MRVAKRTDDRVSVMNELIQGYVMKTSPSTRTSELITFIPKKNSGY